ncbi:sigma-70 family RNA polymerase sigma factor [Faecalicoccus pleomorphus]|nr:sigma-70 family RNA polymerase sigma factor [Faecalicoccus pleomorphus]
MIVENKKVRVPRKAFLVCQNSYRKMLRDSENDKNLYNFADLSKAEKYQINRIAEEERINQWYRKYELNQALNKLNDQEQYIIQEIFFKGHSERELAEKMGLPEKTLNNHKHKILQKLRKIMAEN